MLLLFQGYQRSVSLEQPPCRLEWPICPHQLLQRHIDRPQVPSLAGFSINRRVLPPRAQDRSSITGGSSKCVNLLCLVMLPHRHLAFFQHLDIIDVGAEGLRGHLHLIKRVSSTMAGERILKTAASGFFPRLEARGDRLCPRQDHNL